VIESDYLELVEASNGVKEVWSPHSAILADCFQKASLMSEVSFQHCPREANQLAHELARHAFTSKESFI
jgi:hypothetical protein